ncbi:MAG: hypothetical protein JSV65_19745 [Armatimonadota bacterium]|nr:MAG: hypothetical protein JSV65_19745 [Armatimonadota bacterium]
MAMVSYDFDGSGVVLLVALFAWLAWNRYLHHKELILLHERGGEWQALIADRERWRIRGGIIAGAIVLLLGAGVLAAGLVVMDTDEAGGGVLASLGGAAAAVGLVVLVAHIIWGCRRSGTAECSDTESTS